MTLYVPVTVVSMEFGHHPTPGFTDRNEAVAYLRELFLKHDYKENLPEFDHYINCANSKYGVVGSGDCIFAIVEVEV